MAFFYLHIVLNSSLKWNVLLHKMALFNILRQLHLFKRLSNDLSRKTTQVKYPLHFQCHDRTNVYIIGSWIYVKVPNLDFNTSTI